MIHPIETGHVNTTNVVVSVLVSGNVICWRFGDSKDSGCQDEAFEQI